MASTQGEGIVTFEAAEDLRNSNNEAVKLSGARVEKADTAGDAIIGVIASSASAAAVGTPVGVALLNKGGILKVKAQTTIAAGAYLKATTTAGKVDGQSSAAASTFGIALDAATAADQVISFLPHQAG